MTDDKYTHRPMPDHDAWPVFIQPWDDNTTGPTDVSYLLESPAGARGFIQVVDGHLATGDGERIRFWGNNLTAGGCIPPKEIAPQVVRRMAKLGMNCLRLHFMDLRYPHGIIQRRSDADLAASAAARRAGRDNESTRSLDAEGLDKLDYFIYCCKQAGIYVDINLNVARLFTEADGVKQAGWMGYGKALTYFDPVMIALQKEYAAQLLGHVNPYIGTRYADEPAVAIVELVNENSILESWVQGRLKGEQREDFGTWGDIPPAYAEDLDRLWNAHLTEVYADREAISDAWEGDLRPDEDLATGSVRRLRPDAFAAASAARFRTEAAWLAGIEQAYFVDMQAYLRDEIGVKQLVLGSSDHNHGMNNAQHVANNTLLDVIDGHCYWQHPRYGSGGYSKDNWSITNTPMVDAPDHSAVAQLSRTKVAGMPYIVSEINEPYPNDYASEYWPIIAAYGLLQDWDGIFFYNYVGGPNVSDWADPVQTSFFFTAAEPVKTAQTAICALTFLRGDAQAARELVEQAMPADFVLEALRRRPNDIYPYPIPWIKGRLSLVHRTAISDFDAAVPTPASGQLKLPEGAIVSDTGELTWEEDGHVLVDTPRTQAIVGHAGQRATSHVALDLETPFAAVQVTALGDAPIATAGELLLVAGARVANTGMIWSDDARTTLGSNWGSAPTRIEPVTGTLTLAGLVGATSVTLMPLDGRGQPTGAGQAMQRVGSGWTGRLGAGPATVWYVVRVQR
jgi:hypothetical protein